MHRAPLRIVDQVVDHQHLRPALHQRAAFDIVRPDVAIEDDAGGIVVHQRTLGMFALGMARIRQTLGGEVEPEDDVVAGAFAPFLHRGAGETRAGGGHVLVHAPQEGAVLDHHPRRAHGGQGIGFPPAALGLPVGTGEHADMLDLHIMGLDVDSALDDRDAGAGCGLAGDGQEGVVDIDAGAAKIDHPCHFEHDDARPLGLDRGAQAAGAVGGQCRHPDDPPACPALRGIGRMGMGLLRQEHSNHRESHQKGKKTAHFSHSPKFRSAA